MVGAKTSDRRQDASAAPATELPTLKQGARDKGAVQSLQRELNQEGYHLPVDGSFGPKTKEAVVQFQREQGLAPDGVVGARTWEKLLDDTPSSQSQSVENTRHQGPFGDWRDAATQVSGGDRGFQAMMAFVRRWEGKFTVDHAGPTNYGITQPFYDQYLKDQHKSSFFAKSVASLSESEAVAIYHAQIWSKARAGELAQGSVRAGIQEENLTAETSTALLAMVLGNGAINYGPGRANKFMMQAFAAAGINEGDLGDRAEVAAREGAVQKVLQAYLHSEERHYRDTGAKPKYSQYLNGWLNRHRSLVEQLHTPLENGIPSGLLQKDIR